MKFVNIGIQIKEYLESVGISQVYVSKKTGIPPAKLNLALNNKRALKLPEYAAICDLLKVSTDKFLTPQQDV